MPSKSIITITDDDKQILFTVAHDPDPTGPISTWHAPAKTADRMVKAIIMSAKMDGLEPKYESYKNTETGHTRITTREKESDEPDRTNTKADGDDTRRGGGIP